MCVRGSCKVFRRGDGLRAQRMCEHVRARRHRGECGCHRRRRPAYRRESISRLTGPTCRTGRRQSSSSGRSSSAQRGSRCRFTGWRGWAATQVPLGQLASIGDGRSNAACKLGVITRLLVPIGTHGGFVVRMLRVALRDVRFLAVFLGLPPVKDFGAFRRSVRL